MNDAPQKSNMFDVFKKSLVGADRVVVETKNAVGAMDAHYLHAPALLADLPRAEAPVVAVKPLVWRQSNERCISADAPGFAAYTIFTRDDGQFSLRMSWSLLMTDGYFPTLEAAKSAAQADYDARILSAITMAPADPPRPRGEQP